MKRTADGARAGAVQAAQQQQQPINGNAGSDGNPKATKLAKTESATSATSSSTSSGDGGSASAQPGFWSDLPEDMQLATVQFQKRALKARFAAAQEEKKDLQRQLEKQTRQNERSSAMADAVATAWSALVDDLDRLAGTAAASVFQAENSAKQKLQAGAQDSDATMQDATREAVSSRAARAARGFVSRLFGEAGGEDAAAAEHDDDPFGGLRREDFDRELTQKMGDTKRTVELLVELLCDQAVERAQIATEVRAVLDAVTDAAEEELDGAAAGESSAASHTTAAAAPSSVKNSGDFPAMVGSGELEDGEIAPAHPPAAAASFASAAPVEQKLPVALKGLATELERLTEENDNLRKQLDSVHVEKRGIQKIFNAQRDKVQHAQEAAREAVEKAAALGDEVAQQRLALSRTRNDLEDAQAELQKRPVLSAADGDQKQDAGAAANSAAAAAPAQGQPDAALLEKVEAMKEMYESEKQISEQRERAKHRLQSECDSLQQENDRLRNPRKEDFERFDFVRSLQDRGSRYKALYEKAVAQKEQQVAQYRDDLHPFARKISEAWFAGESTAFRGVETRLRESNERLAQEQRAATKLRRDLDVLKSERRLGETLKAQRKLYEQLHALVQKHSAEHSHLRILAKERSAEGKDSADASIAEANELNEALAAEIDEVSEALEQSSSTNTQLLLQLNDKESTIARHVADALKTTQMESGLRDEAARMQRTLDSAKKAHSEQEQLIAELKVQLKNHAERERALQGAADAAARQARTAAEGHQKADAAAQELSAEVGRLRERIEQDAETQRSIRQERTRALQEKDHANEELLRLKKTADRYKHQAEAVKSGDTDLLSAQVSDLRRKVTCSLCNDREKDTVIARCFHVFCRTCVEKNLQNRNRKCPSCKKGFDQNDVQHLWLDYES